MEIMHQKIFFGIGRHEYSCVGIFLFLNNYMEDFIRYKINAREKRNFAFRET